jgi:hypothetical protein
MWGRAYKVQHCRVVPYRPCSLPRCDPWTAFQEPYANKPIRFVAPYTDHLFNACIMHIQYYVSMQIDETCPSIHVALILILPTHKAHIIVLPIYEALILLPLTQAYLILLPTMHQYISNTTSSHPCISNSTSSHTSISTSSHTSSSYSTSSR